MSNPSCLPVILVSAKTTEAASKLISEIIDEEPSTREESKENEEREWVIENKYYRATVAFRAVGDEAADVGSAEAHVVLLQAGEAVAEAARRVARAPRTELALLAVDADRVPPALLAWAAAERLEPVELRPLLPEPTERPPFGCETGVNRVRSALHAHEWPGLRRHRAPRPRPAASDQAEGDEEEELERFAAAAAALDAAAHMPPAERRARADHLIAALSRALRIPLDDL